MEARTDDGRFQLRDSKLGDTSPILDMTSSEFGGLLADVKASRFDG